MEREERARVFLLRGSEGERKDGKKKKEKKGERLPQTTLRLRVLFLDQRKKERKKERKKMNDADALAAARAAVRPLTLKDLRLQLRARGLTPAGGFDTLRQRLEEHMAETGDW